MKSALKGDLSFLKKVPVLAEATTNTEAAVPGFLYNEIALMTLESDGQHVEAVLNFLLSTLQDGAAHSKLKSLRILQHILQNGHADVKCVLQRKDSAIRMATNISGSHATDARIRDLSKDLLCSLYDDRFTTRPTTCEGGCAQLAQSEESKTFGGLGTSTASSGKYEGFGNTPAPQRTLSEHVTQGITKVVERFTTRNPVDLDLSQKVDPLSEALPKFHRVIVRSPIPEEPKVFGSPLLQPKPKTVPRKKGRPGGGWDDEDCDNEDNVSGRASLSDTSSLQNNEPLLSNPQEQVNSTTEESLAVDSFVSPGLPFPPSKKEIADACERCATLQNVQLLSSRFFCEEQPAQMRALVLLECLLRKNCIDLDREGDQLLASLQKLHDESTDPVKVKARKVYLIIEKLSEKTESFREDHPNDTAAAGSDDFPSVGNSQQTGNEE